MNSLINVDEVVNLSEDECLSYVSSILLNVHSTVLRPAMDHGPPLRDLALRLSNLYFDCPDYLEKICDILIAEDFIKCANNIFKYFINSNIKKDNILDNFLNVLINFSDFNNAFAKVIFESAIFHSFIDFCVDNSDDSSLHEDDLRQCLCNVITITHNVVRNHDNIQGYKVDLFKQTLVKYIKFNNSDDLGLISMLTLSYIIEEDEGSLLQDASNLIGVLIERIKNINPTDNRSGGFVTKELLNGLRCISVNDSLKQKICQENGISVFINILQQNFEIEVKEIVFEILHNLCFISAIKESLLKEYKIKDVIKIFSTNESKKIKEHYDGIMWLIKDGEKLLRGSKSRDDVMQFDVRPGYKFDVFLSYSREYKEIISKIKTEMEGSDLKVWIDDEQMFGSTIEAMAEGIENSKVVIIGISKAYKESPNCRLEAEYAYKLHKPIVPVVLQYKYKPMSWLGIIVGSKMYYEFSERRDVNETMSGIIKSIHKIITQDDCNEEVEEEIKVKNNKVESATMVEVTEQASKKIKSMTKEDVTQWLLEAQLAYFRKYFTEIDGSLLFILLDLKVKAPEYFNLTLKKEFKMKIVDVLKFHKAANCLMEER